MTNLQEAAMSKEDKGFKVKDHRAFSQDKQADDGKEEEKKQTDEPQAKAADESAESGEQFQLPQINFSTFIFSLNASAMVHLGIMDDPASGQKNKNLAMAKQTIDILSMLEEKTAGNLSSDEDKMLKGILYDLKINYVKEKG
jgi:hypothetical protein